MYFGESIIYLFIYCYLFIVYLYVLTTEAMDGNLGNLSSVVQFHLRLLISFLLFYSFS